MSILIQVGATHVPGPGTAASTTACVVAAEAEMGPGLEYDPDVPEASDDTTAIVTVAAPVTSTVRPLQELKLTSHSHHGYPSCFGLPYQDHNYGAPPPPTPPQSPAAKENDAADEDTSFSVISTTSTNNEEEVHEESITRCICGFDHDDEYMICCDRCSVWQHVDCMGLDRNSIPDTYMCEKCEPRRVDRQKAKALQTRKKEEMTVDSSSDDTGDEEHSSRHAKRGITTLPLRGKHIRRHAQMKQNEVKAELGIQANRRIKPSKANKEKPETRKPNVRRRSKSKNDSTSTGDEEAQDAWETSLHEWVDKYEVAMINQYTPEVQLMAGSLKLNGQHDEHVQKISQQLRAQLCKVMELPHSRKCLVATQSLMGDQAIMECRGKFLTVSQFQEQNPVFNKRSYPFVLFYKPHKDEEDVCVDAREYGNEARFVRRSCMPNALVKHVIQNGLLHLYLFASKEIKREQEITIPFDYNYQDCIDEVECACESNKCLVSASRENGIRDNSMDKKRKNRKIPALMDDDSSQSSVTLGILMVSTTKSQKVSPVKTAVELQQVCLPTTTVNVEPAHLDAKLHQDEQETDEQAAEKKRKMTREERKIDAIMRAFERMEKAAKRRQQALERMALHRAQQQQRNQPSEDEAEKQPTPVEEQHSDSVSMSVVIQEEEKPNPGVLADQGANMPEVVLAEETKLSPPLSGAPLSVGQKPRKGKRRRGSGTPGRKRTRTNSGGSDILSPDEMPAVVPTPSMPSTPTVLVPDTDVPLTLCATPPTPLPLINKEGFVFPKSKRFLMNEWMSEKGETTSPVQCPMAAHMEMSSNTGSVNAAYVRCTRDASNTSGISAAHLRRNSMSSSLGRQQSSLGSAKKRWLRQAMFEKGSSEPEAAFSDVLVIESGPGSPISCTCHNPSTQDDASSPGPCVSPPVDIVTPLKKRRLIRESLDSPNILCLSPTTPTERPGSTSSVASPEPSLPSVEETGSPIASHVHYVIEEDYQERFSLREHQNGEEELCHQAAELSSHLLPERKTLDEEWLNKVEDSTQDSASSPVRDAVPCIEREAESVTEGSSPSFVHSVFEIDTDPKEDNAQNSSGCLDLPCQPDTTEKIPAVNSTTQDYEVEETVEKNIDFQESSELSDDSCSHMIEDSRLTCTVKVADPLYNEVNKDSEADCVPVDSSDNFRLSRSPEATSEASCLSNDCASASGAADTSVNFAVLNSLDSTGATSYIPLPPPSSTSPSDSIAATGSSSVSSSDSCQVKHGEATCISATQKSLVSSSGDSLFHASSGPAKRKVSLSEYRMRMKDVGGRECQKTCKTRNEPSPVKTDLQDTKTFEKFPRLSPLPLFEPSRHTEATNAIQEPVKKTVVAEDETRWNSVSSSSDVIIEHRERLSQRLKREFGVSDSDSDSDKEKSVVDSRSPALQNPPPPPPLSSKSGASNSSGNCLGRIPTPIPMLMKPVQGSPVAPCPVVTQAPPPPPLPTMTVRSPVKSPAQSPYHTPAYPPTHLFPPPSYLTAQQVTTSYIAPTRPPSLPGQPIPVIHSSIPMPPPTVPCPPAMSIHPHSYCAPQVPHLTQPLHVPVSPVSQNGFLVTSVNQGYTGLPPLSTNINPQNHHGPYSQPFNP